MTWNERAETGNRRGIPASYPGPSGNSPLYVRFPAGLVADLDRPSNEDLGAGAGPPVGTQGELEAVAGLVHLVARGALGPDPQTDGADAEDAAAGLLEGDAREQEVAAPGRGVEVDPELGRRLSPALLGEQDHLPPPTLVGVPCDPPPGHQGGRAAWVHGAPLEALEVDGAQAAGGGEGGCHGGRISPLPSLRSLGSLVVTFPPAKSPQRERYRSTSFGRCAWMAHGSMAMRGRLSGR